MDLGALIILTLIIVGAVWAFWLIFKRDLMQNQVGKLLSYFIGVIITLIIVLWMVSWFLPWWAARLMQNTQNSAHVQTLQQVSTELWNDLSDGSITVDGKTTQPIVNVTPGPTVSPVAGSASSQLADAPITGCSSRIHTVAAGENLFRISLKYSTTVAAIKVCNPDISGSTIYVGQELTLP